MPKAPATTSQGLEHRPIHELPEKQQAFVHHVAQGLKAPEAYTAAGFAGEGATRAANARKLAKKLELVIQAQVKARIANLVPTSVNAIRDLIDQTDDLRVRLAAAKWVMGTAGYDQPTKHEHVHKHVDQKSNDELKEELRSILRDAVVKGEVLEHDG